MYERPRRARIVLVALLLASTVLITLDFRERNGGPVEHLRHGAIALFGPLERGVTAVLRPIGGALGALAGAGRLRSENRRLQAELDRLRAEDRTFSDLVAENDQLRGTLVMARRCGCRTVGALVVARSSSSFAWSVTIDAGARLGVRKGMPVIDAQGVVGRVVEVTGDYSTVLLLSDPASGVAANLAARRAPGVVKGKGADDLVFEPLGAGTSMRVGDPVVTQAYPGGVFPAGLPIGTVSKVGGASGEGLVQSASVRPFADLASVDVVAVVLASPARPAKPGPVRTSTSGG